jgi:hypothetical protein
MSGPDGTTNGGNEPVSGGYTISRKDASAIIDALVSDKDSKIYGDLMGMLDESMWLSNFVAQLDTMLKFANHYDKTWENLEGFLRTAQTKDIVGNGTVVGSIGVGLPQGTAYVIADNYQTGESTYWGVDMESGDRVTPYVNFTMGKSETYGMGALPSSVVWKTTVVIPESDFSRLTGIEVES